MRPHPRRAQTDPSHPRAWATDDKSGFVGNQVNLRYQYEWQGTQLINKRILCYEDQLDVPNRQLGTIILPPDPVSIPNARIEPYPIDEVWPRLQEIQTIKEGASANSGTVGPNDAQPRYLEISTTGAAQPTIGRSLEVSTIPMLGATS